jgi:diguanylate cyclase (GGDEF)-like protein
MMVMFIDLDGLKTINDTYGHSAGDDAIRFTAEALRSTVRQADLVARLGGDEFLVCAIASHGRAEAESFAERLRQAVAQRSVSAGDKVVPLRCSIGITLSESSGAEVDSLIVKADTALYQAKQRGRNRVAWYTPDLSPAHTP